MALESLTTIYGDLSLEEGIRLEDFIARTQSGEFGTRTREEVTEFLRNLEQEMIVNIENRILAAPHLESQREARIEAMQKKIQGLIDGLNTFAN